jgi:hypothetical protein
LKALKPELYIKSQNQNPDTPFSNAASNADTPTAATSPQRTGEDYDADDLDMRAAAASLALQAAVGASIKQEPTLHKPMVNLEAVARQAARFVAGADSVVAPLKTDESEPARRQAEGEKMESEDRDAARKRKAEETYGELGEDEWLAAAILSGSFRTDAPPSPRSGQQADRARGRDGSTGGSREGKRARQASAKASAGTGPFDALQNSPTARGKASAGGARNRVAGVAGPPRMKPSGTAKGSMALTNKAKGGGGVTKNGGMAVGLDEGMNAHSASWVKKVVAFLQTNGQDLLSSICAHYRIDFGGDVNSIRDYSLEQLAHNAIFNPALPKASGRLPKMLRDISGVSNWHMTFLKDQAGIYRALRVGARLGAEHFTAQCRCCSYCGSCFSGRFMKPNAMHQQAGGWKEITERTAAGKYSWASLRGWRLCVPCFTHWASNGTNVNANRPCIDDLMSEHKDLLSWQTVSDEALDPKTLGGGFSTSPVTVRSWGHQNALRTPISGPPSAA